MGIENVAVVCGDGVVCNSEELYDRIILTAAVSDIAPAWRERLHPRGRLLLPLWLGVEQSVLLLKLVRITCKASGLDPVRFAAAKPHDRPGRHRQPRFPRRRPSHHCYVTVREVQQRLSFWLAVHEPTCGLLVAEGPTAELSYLYGVPGRQYGTWVFREHTSVAALARATHQLSLSNSMHDESLFELFVRQPGPCEDLIKRLLGHISAWDAAGRPGLETASIRVYSSGSALSPASHGVMICRKWTDFVFV